MVNIQNNTSYEQQFITPPSHRLYSHHPQQTAVYQTPQIPPRLSTGGSGVGCYNSTLNYQQQHYGEIDQIEHFPVQQQQLNTIVSSNKPRKHSKPRPQSVITSGAQHQQDYLSQQPINHHNQSIWFSFLDCTSFYSFFSRFLFSFPKSSPISFT